MEESWFEVRPSFKLGEVLKPYNAILVELEDYNTKYFVREYYKDSEKYVKESAKKTGLPCVFYFRR